MIGDRIRMLRQVQELQQEDLAERMRKLTGRAVAIETLSRLENGKNEPAAWMLAASARVLNTTTDYLLGLTDDPNRAAGPPAMPVPEPDLAELVRRLNAEPAEVRALIRHLVDVALELYRLGSHQGTHRSLTPNGTNDRALVISYLLSLLPLDKQLEEGALLAQLRSGAVHIKQDASGAIRIVPAAADQATGSTGSEPG